MRLAALIVGISIALGVLWLAGEEHRKNCIREGRVSCSILPWNNGQPDRSLPTIK